MASSRAVRPSLAALVQPAVRPSSSPAVAAAFLLPRHSQRSQHRPAPFSTCAPLLKRHTYDGARKTRDYSKHRGESTVRRTGPRWRLSVSDDPLPKPLPREEVPKPETDPDHGLWEFFFNRKLVANIPSDDVAHGRAWTVEELRHKSWDDLHKLWWVCIKERNRIATASWEREKLRFGFGDAESKARDREVRRTMRSVKHVLTERFYTWEDAVKLAKDDPEVDLSGNGNAYTPLEYLEAADEAEPLEGDAVAEEKAAARSSPAMDPSAVPAGEAQRDKVRA